MTLKTLAAASCALLIASTFVVFAEAPTPPAGAVLDKNGMTLYQYDEDTEGKSMCVGDCVKVWVPYVAISTDVVSEGWTIIQREDGTQQWAYNKRPVYLYSKDVRPGEMMFDGADTTWHVVTK